MKSILYSVYVGTLALALAVGGARAATDKNKRQERAKPPQRSAARPASAIPATARAQRNVSATQYQQQRSYAKPRTSSTVNRKPVAATPSSQRIGGGGAAATRNSSVNRNRNVAINRANRPASTTPATANVNRFRNTNEFRTGRPTSAPSATVVRNQNVTVNRTQNAAFYRGRNVTVTNNWRGDAFRGQRYWAFHNYNRQWHDRGWWRSHYTRIIFVNSGWWY